MQSSQHAKIAVKPGVMHYHGHRKRLRARLKSAPEQLQDYEVLELLLGHVLLRADTKPLAKELLTRFSSLRGVMQASEDELREVPGLGPGVADFLFLLHEFFARYSESGPRRREELATPEAVAAMARERLGKLAHEEMWVAYVTNSNKLLAWERLTRGSIDGTCINPRDILERALKLKAAGFILVHNHPAGSPRPSANDRDYTKRLDQAARTLFIRFVDHIIVTDDACYSMQTEGLIY